MTRFFILLFFLFSNLNAFEIKEKKDYYNFNDFKIYYNKQNIIDIKEIVKQKDKFIKTNSSNLGIHKKPIWSYAKLKNSTNDVQRLIFTHPRAGLDFIDIYIFEDEKIIQTYQLGDMNPLNNRIVESRKSNFLFELEAKQEYEFFIKYKSFGAIDTNLEIYEPKIYANIVKKESKISGFIIGTMFVVSLLLFYLLIYFPSISTGLFFVILLGSVLIQLSVAGVLYEMGLNSYLNTVVSWSFGNIAAACIGIFPIYYFKLKNISPKLTFILKILSGLLLLLSLSFFFYPLKNELLYLAPIANILFFVITLFLVLVSVVLYKKKIDGYKIYGFANGFFLLCALYFILGLLGFIKTSLLFYYILLLGNIVNIVCLGYLIFSNLLKLKKEKEKAMVLLNEYSKLSSLGQSMINLSHQWKEPLNHIYYAVNNITAAKEFNDPKLPDIIDDSLNQIKETATYMVNTGKNFLNLYENKSYEEELNLRTAIESVLITFRKQIDELNIDLNLEFKEKIMLTVNKYLLANVFMSIIENSIKIFKTRKVKNPKLSINVKKENEKIIIQICDNAGGVENELINHIFEKDFTNSKSTGLGLYLVKNILILKLNGDINVNNKNNGACFTITL